MRKLVIGLIIIFVIFTIINAYPLPLNLMEFAKDKNNFGIGVGILEQADQKLDAWNIFPFHFYLKSENGNIFLSYNLLSIIFKGGINYSRPIVLNGQYKGDIVSVGGKVSIAGRVEGDVWVFNADVILYQNAVVTGNIAIFGGHVLNYPPVTVSGTRFVMTDLQFPLLGILIAPNSAADFKVFDFNLFTILLFIIVLILAASFARSSLDNLSQAVSTDWKSALLFTALALLLLPILTVILIAVRLGILVLPFFFLFLLGAGYTGFLAVILRLGRLIIRGGGSPFSQIMCGFLGFVLLHSLTILGLIFGLFQVAVLKTISQILLTVGAIVAYLAFCYGLGTSLAHFKKSMS